MKPHFPNKLVVAISSRALFDLDESHEIYENEGIKAYADHQISHENKLLTPGIAFGLVKKLLALRSPNDDSPLVEIILLSRNSADTGLRIFNSIEEHQLAITRAAFTSGASTYQYVSAFDSHLFLSADPQDVRSALDAGCAAATICPGSSTTNDSSQLRMAFDGDAVLFSDEAERVYQAEGLKAFIKKESTDAEKPLSGGPFKGFLAALHNIQQLFPAKESPIRTALVTARSAPAHARVIHTFRAWNIRIDEAFFLGGLNKGNFLKAFGADFFFDDQQTHCSAASEHVATGHVPHGVTNE